MTENKTNPMGEWKWEKYVALIAAGLMFVDACLVHSDEIPFWRTNSFIGAIGLGCMFYLSELRYRLFPDTRNN